MLTCPEPAENPVLWPGGAKREEDGQLSFAGQKVTELARRFGTPSYLFDLDDFAARAETIASAMAEEFWEGLLRGQSFPVHRFRGCHREGGDGNRYRQPGRTYDRAQPGDGG